MIRHRYRGLRLVGLVVIVVAALAVFASSAAGFAWTVERTGAIETGETEAFSLQLAKESTATLTGTIAGMAVEITAGGLEGVETKLEASGMHSGKLKFTGLKVVKPAGCGISTTLTTNALKGELIKVGSTMYDKIAPVSGTALTTITLTECALAGTYKLTGSLTPQVEPLETRLAEQPLEFSAANQAAGGGAIVLGGNAANLAMAGRMFLNLLRKFWAVLVGPRYQMSAYGAGLAGGSITNQIYFVNGNEINCALGAFSSSIAAAAVKLSVTPTYTECLAFGLPNEVSFQREGCVLEMQKPIKFGAQYEAVEKIVCPPGNRMTFEVLGGMLGKICEIFIPPQTTTNQLEVLNKVAAPRWVEIRAPAGLIGLNYEVTATEATCPLATGPYIGTYKGSFGLNGVGGKEFFVE